MTILLLIFIVFTILTFRPTKYNRDYLSKKNTNIIRGIFLILVFFSHFISYKPEFQNTWIDTMGIKWIKSIGQLMVTLFLFYSGYGIMESVAKKGKEYIDNLPKRRILPTIIHFDIAVLIYMLVSGYLQNSTFSIKRLILALVGWGGFGNSNWYIFCIVILYFIAFLSLKSFSNKRNALISIFIGTVLFTVIMSFYKEPWWYNTAYCFVLGACYSVYKEKIENFIKGKEVLSLVYLIIIFLISGKLSANIVWFYVYTLSFTLIIILITRKINIKNIALEWIGKNLFPMYIFQRIPMILLNKENYFHTNPYIFFITAFVITIAITLIYNLIIFIYKILKERVLNKNVKENS